MLTTASFLLFVLTTDEKLWLATTIRYPEPLKRAIQHHFLYFNDPSISVNMQQQFENQEGGARVLSVYAGGCAIRSNSQAQYFVAGWRTGSAVTFLDPTTNERRTMPCVLGMGVQWLPDRAGPRYVALGDLHSPSLWWVNVTLVVSIGRPMDMVPRYFHLVLHRLREVYWSSRGGDQEVCSAS